MFNLKPLDDNGAAKNLLSLIFSGTLLLVVGLALLNQQAIFDYYKLRGYVPPTEVAQLATQSTMNDQTRRVFYVNQPVVQDKATFKIDCPDGGGEKTIVLGCYHGGQNGIYLLQVTDPRLNGVKQVTAAHELLHATYDRLSSDERKKVDAMLLNYFENDLKDERIINTIEGYKKTEPNDLINEMHSIFATEIVNLPAELEAYYSKYFTDRKKIVEFANQYQAEFTSRQTAIENYDVQLDSLKDQIAAGEASLTQLQEQIKVEENSLQDLRRSNRTGEFNARVPAFNGLIDQYNQQVRSVQDLVRQYNVVVEERNALASEISELSNALNTDVEQIKQ
jgi:prefoldin subunit 5